MDRELMISIEMIKIRIPLFINMLKEAEKNIEHEQDHIKKEALFRVINMFKTRLFNMKKRLKKYKNRQKTERFI